MMNTDFVNHEQTVAEVLGRWSVADLIELRGSDLEAADRRFYGSTTELEVVSQGKYGPINWWKIRSGKNEYEVRRLENFGFCSCRDFFFRKRPCKHIARTALVRCEHCRELTAKVGKLCYGCDSNKYRFVRRPDAPGASAVN
jgi:hypothetical protein